MAKSTQIITDAKALANGTFTAASQTKSIAAGGPITDLNGVSTAILVDYEEALAKLNYLVQAIDSSDPLLTTAQGLVQVSV